MSLSQGNDHIVLIRAGGNAMRMFTSGVAALLLTATGASAALVTVGNVKYEDFQGTPGTVNGSSPTPSGGTGATSPLDSTWDFNNDAFSATHITNPSNTDYLQTGGVTLSLPVGSLHSISMPESALADGLLPRNSDDPGNPGGHVVFGNGNYRVQIDFTESRLVSEFNSYSWHASTRTMQQYNLLGSDSAVAPSAVGSLATLVGNGWTMIAAVDSNVLDIENTGGANSYDENSKHGASVNVGLVSYRHLLVDNFSNGANTSLVNLMPTPSPSRSQGFFHCFHASGFYCAGAGT